MQLRQFVDSWNSDGLEFVDLNNVAGEEQPYRLRPSRLGRHAYYQAIEHLVYLHGNRHTTVPTVTYGRRADIFAIGHESEARIVQVMRDVGMVGLDYQVPVQLKVSDTVIEGTADLVYQDVVIDLKTASNRNFTQLTKGFNLANYSTQLNCYAHGLGLSNAALVILNKDTSELAYVPVPVTTTHLERVTSIVTLLEKLDTLSIEDGYKLVKESCELPELTPQKRDKQSTGFYLLPYDVRYDYSIVDTLYVTCLNNGVEVVECMHDDEEIMERITNASR